MIALEMIIKSFSVLFISDVVIYGSYLVWEANSWKKINVDMPHSYMISKGSECIWMECAIGGKKQIMEHMLCHLTWAMRRILPLSFPSICMILKGLIDTWLC